MLDKILHVQYKHRSKWVGICCIPHWNFFVPEFHTGTYQYKLYQFIYSHFLMVYPCLFLISIPALLNFHFGHCEQGLFN
jgi:hypothetical protein